jgi:deoxyribonuclease V
MKFKHLHPWNLNPKQAIKIQGQLKTKIKLKKFPLNPKLIAGVDVSFKKGKALGAIVVMSLPELKMIEVVHKISRASYPYIPGLLTFREGPVLEKCFRVLKTQPQVIIFDGQGLAHPRNMGIATHLGILLDKPTIGCAKTWLWGEYQEPAKSRGSFSYLLDKERKRVGTVL